MYLGWFLLMIAAIVAFVILIYFCMFLLLEFTSGFSDARKGDRYSNYNERLVFAWTYDKGFKFGGYWTRALAKKTRTNYGEQYMNNRRGRRDF